MICSICSIEFKTVSSLANHIRWKHKHDEVKKQCPDCSLMIEPTSFKQHIERCRFKQKCPECESIIDYSRRSFRAVRFCNQSCAAKFNNHNLSIGYGAYRKKNAIKRKMTYKDICLSYWDKKCALCDWNISIDVHHIDDNHFNNDYMNLIPLCQNHHLMTRMSEHKDEIRKKINELMFNKFGAIA